MEKFEYLEPTTVEEACALLRRYGDEAKAIAGGQSLIPMMRLRMVNPHYLVSLSMIASLKEMGYSDDTGLTIGAAVTHREVESSPVVRARLSVLSETVSQVGSPPIRNLGTLAGDLCHNECGADPPAALLALGARVTIASPDGLRTLDLANFFVDYFQTALGPDEIVTQVEVPPLSPGAGAVYLKLRRRVVDPAIVGVAACVMLAAGDGLCRDVRIALGGVGPVPFRATAAEEVLRGGAPQDNLIQEAAQAASEATSPVSDAFASENYRKEMTVVFVRRALRKAVDLAKAS
ncbi:MAG: xanthine dehydrogenase family protein subunit M [Dehalococcoidia bacterium]|nr:xanthine dehydrogenase family protein subunit M [Dehalococcoidia bacterium]